MVQSAEDNSYELGRNLGEKNGVETVKGLKDPELIKEATGKLSLAERMMRGVLVKISDSFGSNEGGWYEDRETGEKIYVKFYNNPDQARSEFVANAVYKRLGIRAVDSKLFDFDGRFGIASEEVPGAGNASLEALKKSSDVRDGFVADAYLANWDVIGLVFDNIVEGGDGHLYRIDNGGSLVFRAQGGPKEYPPDRIDELRSFLIPLRSAGQVFEGISEDEMRVQAKRLFETLTDEVIDEIMAEAGFDEEVFDVVKKGLLGRRDWLADRFHLREDVEAEEEVSPEANRGPVRVKRAIDQMRQSESISVKSETTYYPRVGFLADGDSIADQQVDVIQSPTETSVSFKLTKRKTKEVLDWLAGLLGRQRSGDPQSPMVRCSYITYKQPDDYYPDEYYDFVLSAAFIIEVDGLELQISAGVLDWSNFNKPETVDVTDSGQASEHVRSSRGLVRIVGGVGISPEELSRKVNKIVEEILQIHGGLEVPEQDAERALKTARYKWHHKTNTAPEDVESRLTREEVFPGYYTMVEKGRHREYNKISEFAVFHELTTGGAKSILRLLQAGGLMATHERFSRGVFRSGHSSRTDMVTGGADSVFTRIITAAGTKHLTLPENRPPSPFILVMGHQITDRTDWYAYRNDRYGTTKEDVFTARRQRPIQLFEEQRSEYNCENEQMFRRGIAMCDIKCLAVGSEEDRKTVVEELLDAGVTQINGKPVGKFVVLINRTADLIDLAYDREPAV